MSKIPDKLQTMLDEAKEFELLSIDPTRPDEAPAEGFHGWKVLGKTTVKDAEARKKIVAAFKEGVEEKEGVAALCFEPRHGLRMTHDGKTADFVICFACHQVIVYVEDKKGKGFLITSSPQVTFDRVLEEAEVPLPEKSKS